VEHATLRLDPAFQIGPVDPRLFGSFVEHMGRCVYGGVFEPGHPAADEAGFRRDVVDLVRELGVTVVRYPGGNFVSGYRWEDGVGPVEDRPRRLDLAWRAVESNAFGLNEFMRWARAVDTEPMMAVNLGTRGPAEAAELVEYCNIPSGTHASDLRRRHGVADPYDVRLWCLGNEMDGPWQLGHLTAEEYGRLASRAGHAMRRADPGIELVACGSSGPDMPTFGAWEATVLEHCYDQVDYISLHQYFDPETYPDAASFRAAATSFASFIDDVIATADHVRAKLRRTKRIRLSVDEWNVWYQGRFTEPEDRPVEGVPAMNEDDYSATDAMVVGDLLISMLRRADRVAVGCQAQLVNILGLVRTIDGGPAWRQAIFDPFALTARHARGIVLRADTVSPPMATERFGPVPALDATATFDDEENLTVFVVNRADTPIPFEIDVRPFGNLIPVSHTGLAESDPSATNSADHPDRVRARSFPVPEPREGRVTVTLPAVSWHALRFGPRSAAPKE
jgi:alpha-L-arabinofuranosidase